MTLGSFHGLARYASLYQQRGTLRMFLRRSTWAVGLLGAVTLLAGLLLLPQLTHWAIGSDRGSATLPVRRQLLAAGLALVNAAAMAGYMNLQFTLRALGTFRLLGVLDLLYSLGFTLLACLVCLARPDGNVVMAAHAVSLIGAMLLGMVALRAFLRQNAPEVSPESLSPAETAWRPLLGRLIGYGVVATAAGLLWQVANQVSLWYTNHYLGPADGGVYSAYRQLCQMTWLLAGALWAVVYSHAARSWEADDRPTALATLDLTYKLAVLGMMTLNLLALASAPWWRNMLPPGFRDHLEVLGGLLMFFQASANLHLALTAAYLAQRPSAGVAMLAVGIVANALLCHQSMVSGGSLLAAANSAGWGMMLASAAGCLYLRLGGFRMGGWVYILSASPMLLLLPLWLSLPIWAALLAATALAGQVLTPAQRGRLTIWAKRRGKQAE